MSVAACHASLSTTEAPCLQREKSAAVDEAKELRQQVESLQGGQASTLGMCDAVRPEVCMAMSQVMPIVSSAQASMR